MCFQLRCSFLAAHKQLPSHCRQHRSWALNRLPACTPRGLYRKRLFLDSPGPGRGVPLPASGSTVPTVCRQLLLFPPSPSVGCLGISASKLPPTLQTPKSISDHSSAPAQTPQSRCLRSPALESPADNPIPAGNNRKQPAGSYHVEQAIAVLPGATRPAALAQRSPRPDLPVQTDQKQERLLCPRSLAGADLPLPARSSRASSRLLAPRLIPIPRL